MTQLLPQVTITAAVAAGLSSVLQCRKRPLNLGIEFITSGTAASGTSIDAYVQTSFDGGATWFDIANFHLTNTPLTKLLNLSALTPVTSPVTPGTGALASNTAVDGLLGTQFRVSYVTVGTYTGATKIAVNVVSDEALTTATQA